MRIYGIIKLFLMFFLAVKFQSINAMDHPDFKSLFKHHVTDDKKLANLREQLDFAHKNVKASDELCVREPGNPKLQIIFSQQSQVSSMIEDEYNHCYNELVISFSALWQQILLSSGKVTSAERNEGEAKSVSPP